MWRAVFGLVVVVACAPAGGTRDAAVVSCEVGTVRACGCGLDGLDGVGSKVCVADGARGVFVECVCDAGVD